MNVIEDTLLDFQRRQLSDGSSSSSSSSNTGSYNIVDALITAAINDNAHIDCVYFLLRRHPDVLQKILLSSLPAAAASAAETLDSNDNGYDSEQRKRKGGGS
jgi:hypothetical protein